MRYTNSWHTYAILLPFLYRPTQWNRLAKKIQKVFYCKGLVIKEELYINPCKKCQHFKKRKTICGSLLPKNVAELKALGMVHVDLIGPYRNYIIQKHPGRATINNCFSLCCMTMVGTTMGWFKIVKVLTFDLYEVTCVNNEYIDKSYSRLNQFFNNP